MEPALKQRLVGASVIIALAVIFVPMIFDDVNIEENQSITIEIPQEPTGLTQKIINIDTNTNTDAAENIVNTPAIISTGDIEIPVIETQETILDLVDNSENIEKQIAIPPTKKPDSVKEKPQTKPKVEPKPESKPETDKVTSNTNIATYRVKYGAFSQQKNAQQLKAKIIHNGLGALVEKDAATGMYRVYSKKSFAENTAKNLLNKVSKLNLKIGKPSLEKMSKKRTEEAQMLLDTGWIVQIGIFSSRENSIKLRDKIRNKGFICFVDKISNSKNEALYRVRVGPFAEHSKAGLTKIDIKLKMDLKGLVKPHEKQVVVN